MVHVRNTPSLGKASLKTSFVFLLEECPKLKLWCLSKLKRFIMKLRDGSSCDLFGNLSLEQVAKYQDPHLVHRILDSSRTIAVVGLSTSPQKDSHVVASFLQNRGFKVIPVHPKAERILGEKVYRKVADIPEPVDIVNVFRPSHECPEHAEQAVRISAKALWLQLNIFSKEAAAIATAGGLDVIMGLCMKIEHHRHLGSQSASP